MVTTWRAVYSVAGGSLLATSLAVWALQVLTNNSKMDISKLLNRLNSPPHYLQVIKALVEYHHPMVEHWLGAIVRNVLAVPRDVAILLCWYPITFSLGTLIRTTGFVCIATTIHVAVVIYTIRQANQDASTVPPSIISLWVDLKSRMRRRKKTVAGGMMVLFYVVFLGPLRFFTLLAAALGWWLSLLIINDRTMQDEMYECLMDTRKFLPAPEDIELLLDPYIGPIHSILKEIVRQGNNLDGQRFQLHFGLGFSLGALLTFVCVFRWEVAVILLGVACAPPILRGKTGMGMACSIIAGLFLFVSVEGLFTGYIFAIHLTYPWRLIELVLCIPFWFIWFWVCICPNHAVLE